MFSVRQLLITGFLALLLQGSAAAEQLPLRAYDIQNGLASDSVVHILRDSRGYLWFATTDGLARFTPGRAEGQPAFASVPWGGAPREAVYALYEDRLGRLWVGGEDRVAMIETIEPGPPQGNRGTVRDVPLGALGAPAGRIGGFAETADGS